MEETDVEYTLASHVWRRSVTIIGDDEVVLRIESERDATFLESLYVAFNPFIKLEHQSVMDQGPGFRI